MMQRFRAYLPAAILLAGSLLILRSRSQAAVPLAGSLTSVMPVVSGYEVIDQKISAREQAVAGMSDYIARSYRRNGAVAFTTLVSYYERQTQGSTIHSPRNCLPGAGWEIVNGGTKVVMVDGVPRTINRYILKNRGATAVAYYWYQGRGRVTASEYVVKWNLLRDAALAGRTEEALVRVVVPVDGRAQASASDAGVRAADNTAESVTKRLMTEVEGVLPRSGAE